MTPKNFLLPLIIFSQFAGTSLWFAGNAILPDIHSSAGFANITSIVQFGFIAGTFVFAMGAFADRFSAPLVFLISAFLAGGANLLMIEVSDQVTSLYICRFITGFFLAGIYPVGLKIAADSFPGKMGNALGFLVGALVLGTAFPHFLKSLHQHFYWKNVLWLTSLLAITGGIFIYLLVPPSQVKPRTRLFDHENIFSFFRDHVLRKTALGYFGHMWELYAFWAFVPVLIHLFNEQHQTQINISLWSFIVIAAGSLGCIAGGLLSQKIGSKTVACYALLLSGCCCLFSPFLVEVSTTFFKAVLVVWGITVIADSPQFSTLIATAAGKENRGTALTLVTCVGFAITIPSIQLLEYAISMTGKFGYLILLPGPVFGLIQLSKIKLEKQDRKSII